MEELRDYKHNGMKKIRYSFQDVEEFKKEYSLINSDLIDKLFNYLKENNTYLITDDTYDAQSGWQGQHIIIDKFDLSGNGYCFTNNKIEKFLSSKRA